MKILAISDEEVPGFYEYYTPGIFNEYDLIKKLASKDIIDFHKYRNRDEAIVECKNCIIGLKCDDCTAVLAIAHDLHL